MRLAVFDIDGTLTDTCKVDAECFAAAVAAVFGVLESVVEGEWRSYPHITDTGIAGTLVERHLGRTVEPAEIARFKCVFVDLLTAEFDRAPQRCKPVAGAVEFVADLTASHDWQVAFATGGFRGSALLKLMRAGFDPPAVLATSGEAISRADIVRTAIRAAGEANPGGFQSVVLLGDADWDVSTGHELNLPCIGIGNGAAAAELQAIGAVAVLADYADRENAYRTLSAAALRPD